MLPLMVLVVVASAPPPELLAHMRTLVVNDFCPSYDQPGPLGTDKWHALKNGALLVLVQVPSYLCTKTNDAVPVVIDERGKWKWGKAISGLVGKLGRSKDGALWLESEWQVEGGYPIYATSKDGLTWTEKKSAPEIVNDRGAWKREANAFKNGAREVVFPATLPP